jgi:hypothetical protein
MQEFDAGDPGVQTGRGTDSEWIESGTWVDAVLYDEEPAAVDFTELETGVVLFGLSVDPDDEIDYDWEMADDGQLVAEMSPLELPGGIRVPVTPCSFEEYFERTEIDPEFVGRGVDEYGTIE